MSQAACMLALPPQSGSLRLRAIVAIRSHVQPCVEMRPVPSRLKRDAGALAAREPLICVGLGRSISDKLPWARRYECDRSRGAEHPRSCYQLHPQLIRGSGEGRVPTAPAVRVQQKAPGRTTGDGRTSGLPCALVLTATSRSPRCAGFLATVTCAMREHHRKLDTSIGVSGPHDFAVRNVPFVDELIARCDIIASNASHTQRS
jgi:hypothetical protein